MKRFDEALERFLWRVGRQPERVVWALAGLSYGGIGLALPLILGWSTQWLVFANVLGTMWAGVFILMWLANGAQARSRQRLVEWTTDLRRLNAREFEWLVGELFRRDGWTVEEVGGHGVPDGNVDLRLRLDKRMALVQCKRWESYLVGVDEVRKFVGTLTKEGVPPDSGYIATLSDFTEPARREADSVGLILIDGQQLYERIERAKAPESCPICASPMKLSHSTYGWWFRCVVNGCTGKRDLAADPGRAVELLTTPR